METPSKHSQQPRRQAARYLVVIESGGALVAKLFLETREKVAEFDASTVETASMIGAHASAGGGTDPAWDHALAGHSDAERAQAQIYWLDV
ncbi:hypothetical protein [Roseateles sp.]|uniref:hypothetical protein n=1 Tax=Roseateles sp. TaxID=1971397 RepID=UPI00286A3096|nr:hypothetical protein [Roseateles sp.]